MQRRTGSRVQPAGNLRRRWPALRLFAIVAACYASGSVLSWYTFGAAAAPAFFPPAGVTVAAMLLSPRSRWPVVVAAIVVAELVVDISQGTAVVPAAGWALANAVEPIVGAAVVTAWCGGAPDLRNRAGLARYVIGACVLGPLVGALIGASVSVTHRDAWWPGELVHWWAGDGVGALVVGCPILLWPLQSRVVAARRAETVLVLTATALVAAAAFWFGVPPAIAILPVLAWAALRLGPIGAALSGAVLAFVANVMTQLGRGTFAALPLPPSGQLAMTQAFIAVVVLVAIVVAQEATGRVAAIEQREAEHRERARLESLARLAQLLSAALTPRQIGDAVVAQVLNDADAQALSLGVISSDGRTLQWVSMAGYPPSVLARFGDGVPLDTPAAATEAIRTGRPVVIRHPAEYRTRYPQTAALMAETRTAALVNCPLISGAQVIGTLGLGWTRWQPLDAAQLAYTSAVAVLVAQALTRARVYEDEHTRAVVLQAAVQPPVVTQLPDMEIAVKYEPADAVRGLGGDWYDAITLPDGRAYFAVGDVVGHGLAAVQDMAQLRSAGRAFALQGLTPADLLAELNTFARHVSHGKFATVAVAVYDPVQRLLDYGCAGHPPPFLRRITTAEVGRLGDAHGIVLGVSRGRPYVPGQVRIDAGDILVMYTDGLVEGRGRDIETGMRQAQLDIAGWQAETPLQDLCGRFIARLAPPPRDDDTCVLAVRFG